MDNSKALNKLMESADLLRMLEDLTGPTSGHPMSQSTLNGFRITLRNIRESILTSHDSLAGDLVSRIRLRAENAITDSSSEDGEEVSESLAALERQNLLTDPGRMIPKRSDIRTSIEKIVGR